MRGLPDGWVRAPVSTLGELRLGKMLDKAKNKGEPAQYLRNVNVRWFDFDLTDLQDIRVDDEERTTLSVRDGDLMICEGGEPGRCAVWKSGPNSLVYQKALHRFRSNGSVDTRFMMFQLKYLASSGRLQDAFTGTTIKHLTRESLSKLDVIVPPLAEQKRIADKLDRLLAAVDTCKARLDAIPAILKRFRQSVLAAATSGALTEEWRRLYQTQEVTPLPISWATVTAVSACTTVQSGGTPKGKPFSETGDIPFLKVYNIVNQQIAFQQKPQFIPREVHESELSRSIGYPGDVVMNIVGPPLGKVAVLGHEYPEWNMNQAITVFRPDPSILESKFLYYFLCSGALVRDVIHDTRGSVGQVNISLTQCREAFIPIPPLMEQREIVRRVDYLFSMADELDVEVNAARVRIEKMVQSLLAKAFRGELRCFPESPIRPRSTTCMEEVIG